MYKHEHMREWQRRCGHLLGPTLPNTWSAGCAAADLHGKSWTESELKKCGLCTNCTWEIMVQLLVELWEIHWFVLKDGGTPHSTGVSQSFSSVNGHWGVYCILRHTWMGKGDPSFDRKVWFIVDTPILCRFCSVGLDFFGAKMSVSTLDFSAFSRRCQASFGHIFQAPVNIGKLWNLIR